jgi:predicted SnoaL-like aldol condensation-catalyzing enzyme
MEIRGEVRAAALLTCLLAGASLIVTAPLVAQGYLTGAALNKRVVTDFYRLVFEPRNPDLLDQYIALDFVEHNPAVARGKFRGDRTALVAFIKTLPKAASDDIGSEMKSPPAYVVAEGDMVTVIFKQQVPDPKDKSKTYGRFSCDMFRIKNGKIVEHWGGAAK